MLTATSADLGFETTDIGKGVATSRPFAGSRQSFAGWPL
jgi:hypothetical protein